MSWWNVKGCSFVRDRERFARSRLSNQEAAIHRLVQGAHHQESQRPPGGHGGLLRLRQGRRALHGRMGALQGSGRRCCRVQRVRDQGDALPRPWRQHRPRRRSDVPGHPVAAAGLSNGHAPVDGARRDGAGQVRPAADHRPPAGDLHDGGAASDAAAAASAARPNWRHLMEEISRVSCAHYRRTVYEDPEFITYFQEATPQAELGFLNIGSRPAKRKPAGGISSLRAIPWVFAWTQTRLVLPARLGVGAGLQDALDRGHGGELRAMYAEWPFFQSTLDLIEMVTAKADAPMAAHYEEMLVAR